MKSCTDVAPASGADFGVSCAAPSSGGVFLWADKKTPQPRNRAGLSVRAEEVSPQGKASSGTDCPSTRLLIVG